MKMYSSECAYFDNLIAIKYTWLDRDDFKRLLLSEQKYQMILIVKANFRTKRIEHVGRIDENTFRPLLADKLDSFFFVERDLLAMIIIGVVNVVDWRTSEIVRKFEIKDLYSPIMRAGIRHEKIFTKFWYDRRERKLKFLVGKFSRRNREQEKKSDRYLTDLDEKLFDVEFYYGGWFKDSALFGEELLRDED